MKRNWIKDIDKMKSWSDWKWGTLSGFPICCKAHFSIRKLFLDKFKLRSIHEQVFFWMQDNLDFVSRFDHIPCPIHFSLAALRIYCPQYTKCKSCSWIQQKKSPCLLCGNTTARHNPGKNI
jgi:hypothetical protein